ncbi:hypothetical protein CDAR_374421 [Caerostris darwini]|uniref:Uncharacterized protein n=1 Tax=Caerostris darwini TaxID=1538125 RepID=A0AAV4UNZ9_9ARAC|nr:hypothetical protein CDAR_374421 [Caerostris darwini]
MKYLSVLYGVRLAGVISKALVYCYMIDRKRCYNSSGKPEEPLFGLALHAYRLPDFPRGLGSPCSGARTFVGNTDIQIMEPELWVCQPWYPQTVDTLCPLRRIFLWVRG